MTSLTEEKARIEAALAPPYDTLLQLLPGKIYFGILVRKIGLEKEAYVDLIVSALQSKQNHQLHELGITIRAALQDYLPSV